MLRVASLPPAPVRAGGRAPRTFALGAFFPASSFGAFFLVLRRTLASFCFTLMMSSRLIPIFCSVASIVVNSNSMPPMELTPHPRSARAHAGRTAAAAEGAERERERERASGRASERAGGREPGRPG